ncbi:hypothetical protein MycrhN_2377 [Mycolicibacterium rhodesiae NBB3]|uniref:Secreted protein n=1 Tax=Mycolicibacterium rhodesiae (strain NBB3) TaxID=710685 RepID=G8RV94_MYCRN|nr:hypothetical protein [Mycolicibacterium rhodesiae]AEV72966.1 hypothetical protein MycrhN_2377 [Mycolicibacterium rhodesiae NBB3]
MNKIARLAATALASAVLTTAIGVGSGAWSATAQGGYSWCPGQPLPMHGLGWDMTVCHSFVTVPFGTGNVPMFDVNGNTMQSHLWMDSPPPPLGPPPPLPPRPAHCPPWNVIIGPSECGGL